jgi:hypothetical protein
MDSTVSIHTKIDEIVRENKIFRFALELQNTVDETRKELIKHKLKTLQGSTTNESQTTAKSQLDNIYDNIDVFTLKQKWTKLNEKQKQERIKHYIKTSGLNEIKQTKLQDKITEMTKGKLFKVTYIDYDNKEGKINSINIPDFNLESSDDESSDNDESESDTSSCSDSDD